MRRTITIESVSIWNVPAYIRSRFKPRPAMLRPGPVPDGERCTGCRQRGRHHLQCAARTPALFWWGDLLAYCRWGKTQRVGSQSLEEWRASEHQDLHSIQWEPFFVDVAAGDFRLEPGSPAAGRGRPVPDLEHDHLGRPRPADAPPAIGAFEPETSSSAFLPRGDRA